MDDENPYAPPKSDFLDLERSPVHPDQAYRDGKLLVARDGAVLPDRCLKCNAPAEGYQFSRSLTWHRPAWFLLVVISLLLYMIVYFFIRWKARVTVGLCPRHRRRRARAIAIGWLTALAGLAAIIASASASNEMAPVGIIGGIFVLIGGIFAGMFGSRVLVPRRIDEHYVWLSHVSPEYLAEFPDWAPF